MTGVTALLIVGALRFLDLFTTWVITPDLKLEVNPIVRWLGWKRSIFVNIAACIIVSLAGGIFFYTLCGVSILAFLWNLRILWQMMH